MRVISVVSTKGGVGKSTTAIHLAAFFQRKGPTVLVDRDLNRTVLNWAKMGLSPFKVVDEDGSAEIVAKAEYVVIDYPAQQISQDTLNWVRQSTLAVIPASPDAFSLVAMLQAVTEFRQLPQDRYRILLTICPPAPSKLAKEARKALIDMGVPLFDAQIRRASAFQKSSVQGTPVYAIKGDHRRGQAWSDYERVGKEIMELLDQKK